MVAVLERWLPYTVTILDRFHCMNGHTSYTEMGSRHKVWMCSCLGQLGRVQCPLIKLSLGVNTLAADLRTRGFSCTLIPSKGMHVAAPHISDGW